MTRQEPDMTRPEPNMTRPGAVMTRPGTVETRQELVKTRPGRNPARLTAAGTDVNTSGMNVTASKP